ncbi:MAG TPA: chalcone isomerase family protein [Comamonas sp.]|uniref:chalcone isomerase family protein n=1 Tax=Comamonas halotolerans TaxID=3041496 RepID=UPI0024E18366|nr:chalcone isomerase family protein [Comamonas sp. NoAH]
MLTAYAAPGFRLLRLVLARLLLILCATGLPSWSQTTESAELAAHPETIEVQGQTLHRNGVGVRTKGDSQLYSAALYLEKPTDSLQAIGQLSGPKRISVHMLRNINASELGTLFAHGMENNMDKRQLSLLIPGVMRMSEVFNRYKGLKAGDSFTLDWIPQKGMQLSINGQPDTGQFPEAAFYQAMLGIWLGPQPADSRLKAQLLHRSVE